MDDEIDIWTMPENSEAQIIDKIEAMADSIRMDWSDPRSEVRAIKALSKTARFKQITYEQRTNNRTWLSFSKAY